MGQAVVDDGGCSREVEARDEDEQAEHPEPNERVGSLSAPQDHARDEHGKAWRGQRHEEGDSQRFLGGGGSLCRLLRMALVKSCIAHHTCPLEEDQRERRLWGQAAFWRPSDC